MLFYPPMIKHGWKILHCGWRWFSQRTVDPPFEFGDLPRHVWGHRKLNPWVFNTYPIIIPIKSYKNILNLASCHTSALQLTCLLFNPPDHSLGTWNLPLKMGRWTKGGKVNYRRPLTINTPSKTEEKHRPASYIIYTCNMYMYMSNINILVWGLQSDRWTETSVSSQVAPGHISGILHSTCPLAVRYTMVC